MKLRNIFESSEIEDLYAPIKKHFYQTLLIHRGIEFEDALQYVLNEFFVERDDKLFKPSWPARFVTVEELARSIWNSFQAFEG